MSGQSLLDVRNLLDFGRPPPHTDHCGLNLYKIAPVSNRCGDVVWLHTDKIGAHAIFLFKLLYEKFFREAPNWTSVDQEVKGDRQSGCLRDKEVGRVVLHLILIGHSYKQRSGSV